MSDEIIPWEVDTRITGLQAEIERLRRWKEEATQVLNSWDKVWYELGRPGDLGREISESSLIEIRRLKDFNQRLMKELSQHGWGDFHYGPQEQDRNIVALLEEGGFQYREVVGQVEALNKQRKFCVAPSPHQAHYWVDSDDARTTRWCPGESDYYVKPTMETRPGSRRNDGIRTTGQETV